MPIDSTFVVSSGIHEHYFFRELSYHDFVRTVNLALKFFRIYIPDAHFSIHAAGGNVLSRGIERNCNYGIRVSVHFKRLVFITNLPYVTLIISPTACDKKKASSGCVSIAYMSTA